MVFTSWEKVPDITQTPYFIMAAAARVYFAVPNVSEKHDAECKKVYPTYCELEPCTCAKGTWPNDDLRRAFVTGVAWWEWVRSTATIWTSDRRLAETEAERRYPNGQPREGMAHEP